VRLGSLKRSDTPRRVPRMGAGTSLKPGATAVPFDTDASTAYVPNLANAVGRFATAPITFGKDATRMETRSKARPVGGIFQMTWKDLRRLAVCTALMVLAGYLLQVSFSDGGNSTRYGPNDRGAGMASTR
jgi:hypothetical protein